MAKKTINIGTGYDTNDGEKLRDGGESINENFTELYLRATEWTSQSYTERTVVIHSDTLYILKLGIALPFNSLDIISEIANGDWIDVVANVSLTDYMKNNLTFIKTAGATTFNDNVEVRFGTDVSKSIIFSDGTDTNWKIKSGALDFINNVGNKIVSFLQNRKVEFFGTVSGLDGVEESDFVTKGQLDTNSSTKTVIDFIATPGQTLLTGLEPIPDNGNWDVFIGSEFQRSRTGEFSSQNGNISIDFDTGDITFHNPLFGGTSVLIRY